MSLAITLIKTEIAEKETRQAERRVRMGELERQMQDYRITQRKVAVEITELYVSVGTLEAEAAARADQTKPYSNVLPPNTGEWMK